MYHCPQRTVLYKDPYILLYVMHCKDIPCIFLTIYSIYSQYVIDLFNAYLLILPFLSLSLKQIMSVFPSLFIREIGQCSQLRVMSKNDIRYGDAKNCCLSKNLQKFSIFEINKVFDNCKCFFELATLYEKEMRF